MHTSTMPAPSVTGSRDQGDAAEGEFALDVRIVETGPAAQVLMANTDDGCNTIKGSDC